MNTDTKKEIEFDEMRLNQLEVDEKLAKVIRELETIAIELEAEIEETEETDKIRKALTKAIQAMLAKIGNEYVERTLKEYGSRLKTNDIFGANEVLFFACKPIARTVRLSTKDRTAHKQLIKAIARNFRIKVDKQIEEVIKNILGVSKYIIDLDCKIDEARIRALNDILERLIRPTKPWTEYYSKIPALTAHTVGLLFGNAPPHRFDHFGKYRVYIGTAPRKYYEQVSQILGRPKHWHPRAKNVFYVTVMNVLTKKSLNPYYAKIFNERLNENASVVAKKVEAGEIPKDKAKLVTFLYALKETVDIFAHHFWYMWRKAHGLPVEDPYPIAHREKLGLRHAPYYHPAIYDARRKVWISVITNQPIYV